MNPYVLLVVGLVLILLEFFLPGAVLGIAGVISIIAGVVIIAQSGTAMEFFIYCVLAIAGITAVVKYALWQIPRTKNKGSLYLSDDQEGFKASTYDAAAIGKNGVALTDLKPGGYILVDGVKHQASSVSGYITKGTEITVISGQEESLLVNRKRTTS